MKYPKLSIVMPVYNEEDKIERCLKSIREQDYPQDKIEIVFVDDDSTDNTLKLSRKYGIKYVRNGKHDYDIGKSLGVKNASGEYVMFLDADNILTTRDWIRRVITPLLEDESIVGSQPLWFKYNKNYTFFDRYCTLYGITDPLTIYLDKRDRLMLWEKKWKVGLIEERRSYFLAEFNQNNLPTIGSVGFTIKKSAIKKTNCDPALSHLDCIQDLLKLGENRFAMVKLDVIHLHSKNFLDFLGKLERNLNIFIRDFNKRRYKWHAPLSKKIYAALAMLTFVLPAYHSLRGYFKIRDVAWFAHPFICFLVMITYLKMFAKWKLRIKE